MAKFVVTFILFFTGVLGIITHRKNILVILMCIELILLGVNINFLLFNVQCDGSYWNEIGANVLLGLFAIQYIILHFILYFYFEKPLSTWANLCFSWFLGRMFYDFSLKNGLICDADLQIGIFSFIFFVGLEIQDKLLLIKIENDRQKVLQKNLNAKTFKYSKFMAFQACDW